MSFLVQAHIISCLNYARACKLVSLPLVPSPLTPKLSSLATPNLTSNTPVTPEWLACPQVLSSPHLHVPLPKTLYLFPLNLLNFYLSFKTQIRHHLLQEILLDTPPTWSQIAHLHTSSVQISYHLKKHLKDEVPLHLELNARGKIHSPKNCRK